MSGDDDSVTLSEIEHFTYCTRQWALISTEGIWRENVPTVRGSIAHNRVDLTSVRVERGRRVLRGLTVWSDRHGLYGRADVVELAADGALVPVEYKSGSSAGLPARLQLAAQAVCLEEMFAREVMEGTLWLGKSRKRVTVPIDETLRNQLMATIAEIRTTRALGILPAARFDKRCRECSLLDDCLPQFVENRHRLDTIHGMLFSPRGGPGA